MARGHIETVGVSKLPGGGGGGGRAVGMTVE